MVDSEVPAAEATAHACRRCEDWTTIIIKGVEAPCPACRPNDYKAWLDAGNKLPRP